MRLGPLRGEKEQLGWTQPTFSQALQPVSSKQHGDNMRVSGNGVYCIRPIPPKRFLFVHRENDDELWYFQGF